MQHRTKIILCFAILTVVLATTIIADNGANPSYNRWAKFKIGSFARYTQVNAFGARTMTSYMVYTLAAVDPSAVAIEQVTTIADSGPNSRKNVVKIPSIGGSYLKAVVASPPVTKDIAVGGKTYTCFLAESNLNQAGQKLSRKAWFSDEIPGGLVKSVTTIDDGKTVTEDSIELTDFGIAK